MQQRFVNKSTKEKLLMRKILLHYWIENNELAYVVKVNNYTNEFESTIWMFPE